MSRSLCRVQWWQPTAVRGNQRHIPLTCGAQVGMESVETFYWPVDWSGGTYCSTTLMYIGSIVVTYGRSRENTSGTIFQDNIR